MLSTERTIIYSKVVVSCNCQSPQTCQKSGFVRYDNAVYMYALFGYYLGQLDNSDLHFLNNPFCFINVAITYRVAITPVVYSDFLAHTTGSAELSSPRTVWFRCLFTSVKLIVDDYSAIHLYAYKPMYPSFVQ